jgi:hypothetical protein
VPLGNEPTGQRAGRWVEQQVRKQRGAPANPEKYNCENFGSRDSEFNELYENRVRDRHQFLLFDVAQKKSNETNQISIGGHHSDNRAFEPQISQPNCPVEERCGQGWNLSLGDR